MDRRLKLENLNCLILEFFFSKIYFLDQIYWQALVRPFKWHIGKVCIISRKKVTESGKNVKKGLKFVLFHFFDNENGENIFFGPSQLKVPKRWVLMVLKVFQCLLKQKSYKPNKIFLDLLSTNWAFEPLCCISWFASCICIKILLKLFVKTSQVFLLTKSSPVDLTSHLKAV